MDFTREPIIETIVTPREGCKLVIRSSKGAAGQEEFFVDAVEVVSFGSTFFFRSLERPKAFLVPASDYEILEVRETKMVLKNVGLDRSIKIASGKEKGKVKLSAPSSSPKESLKPIEEPVSKPEQEPSQIVELKKRDKRRHARRRRGKERALEGVEQEKGEFLDTKEEEVEVRETGKIIPSMILNTLLPPPPTLISETIERYKGNALFKDVFYKDVVEEEGEKEEEQAPMEESEEENMSPFDEKGEEEFSDREEDIPLDISQDMPQEASSEEEVNESNSAQESGSFS